jgi:hypothetical protein
MFLLTFIEASLENKDIRRPGTILLIGWVKRKFILTFIV